MGLEAIAAALEPVSRAAMLFELMLTENCANDLQRRLEGYEGSIVGDEREPAEATLEAMRERIRDIRSRLWGVAR